MPERSNSTMRPWYLRATLCNDETFYHQRLIQHRGKLIARLITLCGERLTKRTFTWCRPVSSPYSACGGGGG